MLSLRLFFLGLLLPGWLLAQPVDPTPAVERIAQKLLANTPFEYRLRPRSPLREFDRIAFLNFGHNMPVAKPAVAYAISSLVSPQDTTLAFDLSHSDDLRIWVNGAEVYRKQQAGTAQVAYRERYIGLSDSFSVPLQRGVNHLLIKSAYRGKSDWTFYLRPRHRLPGLQLRVDSLPYVHSSMAAVTNWLLMGPFPNPRQSGSFSGLDTPYPPETEFATAKLYAAGGRELSWFIPRPEIKAEGFGSSMAWGDNNFSWNYHAGGTAWAMGQLGHYLDREVYRAYSRRYCDFFLEKRSYLARQKYQNGGLDEGDTRIWESQMLDFTGAPALAYQFWLQTGEDFPEKSAYADFIREIEDYVRFAQVRLPAGNFTRETPKRYTTWTDDMFMGIPFLVQAARLSEEPEKRNALFDDAVQQVFAFNQQVFDAQAGLYRQAQFSEEKVKIPFWSRANGWALWAVTELLTYLPEEHPRRPEVMAHYRRHVETLRRHPDPESGFWHNLIDKPDSFEETSGTAIFVMAMARGLNQGWLSPKRYDPVVRQGWQALETMIDPDGTLRGTCIGTNMSEDEQHYYERPVASDDTHGIFPVIFAGMEVDQWVGR